jgi:hypothetical protein
MIVLARTVRERGGLALAHVLDVSDLGRQEFGCRTACTVLFLLLLLLELELRAAIDDLLRQHHPTVRAVAQLHHRLWGGSKPPAILAWVGQDDLRRPFNSLLYL